jgi:hypothetical protein
MWLLVLEPASADFTEKTELTYIASHDGAFDSSVACFQFRSIGEAFGIAEVPTSSRLGGQFVMRESVSHCRVPTSDTYPYMA